eukprot:GHVH01008793.1.p1 GENE.GHVH01008793.1~~GHVH01008793.1.p1  ORF type:complete len:264 (+),score=31.08 GHVH01008793.1:777-1568(+)
MEDFTAYFKTMEVINYKSMPVINNTFLRQPTLYHPSDSQRGEDRTGCGDCYPVRNSSGGGACDPGHCAWFNNVSTRAMMEMESYCSDHGCFKHVHGSVSSELDVTNFETENFPSSYYQRLFADESLTMLSLAQLTTFPQFLQIRVLYHYDLLLHHFLHHHLDNAAYLNRHQYNQFERIGMAVSNIVNRMQPLHTISSAILPAQELRASSCGLAKYITLHDDNRDNMGHMQMALMSPLANADGNLVDMVSLVFSWSGALMPESQ